MPDLDTLCTSIQDSAAAPCDEGLSWGGGGDSVSATSAASDLIKSQF